MMIFESVSRGGLSRGGGEKVADRAPACDPVVVSRHRYDASRFVLASVDRVDEAWRASDQERGFYVGVGGEGSNQPGKYDAARREVAAGHWTPPSVSFVGDDRTKVAFSDGRHRFAAARDLGRRSVLLEVEPEQAAAFREKFGV